MRAFDVRIEDVLTVMVAVILIITGSAAGGVSDNPWWEYSFVVFPATLIILAASIRYAFGGTEGAAMTVRRIGSVVRDWLPFALFLMFYETLRSRLWQALTIHERDAELLAIDQRIFGGTPAVAMQAWISPMLTEVLAACYFLHLILPPVLATLWYRRDLKTFRLFLLSIFLCGALGSACYLAVPAVGPEAAFPSLFTVPLGGGGTIHAVSMMDEAGRAPHDVFPSLHITISAIVLWFAWLYGRRTFWLMLPLIVGNWISTMYLRYHYAIDVVAGFALAPLCVLLARALLSIENSGALKRLLPWRAAD